jgi:thiol:disulfide interchange protein
MREAEAGAQMTGTTFVSVDVTQDAIESLNTRYGVIQDPAVLVLKPPGDLVVRIDGFADRDTVAQAAANAAS